MKEHDIVELETDFEFEAINNRDKPIGFRTIPKGTRATIISASQISKGWVTIEFPQEEWKKEWGAFDVLEVPIFEVPLKVVEVL